MHGQMKWGGGGCPMGYGDGGRQMGVPLIPAPVAFVAFMFGIMMGAMMSRRKAMMMQGGGMGMMHGDRMGMMHGSGMGPMGGMGMTHGGGMGGDCGGGDWMMRKKMMRKMGMHHHHHGFGMPECKCGGSENAAAQDQPAPDADA